MYQCWHLDLYAAFYNIISYISITSYPYSLTYKHHYGNGLCRWYGVVDVVVADDDDDGDACTTAMVYVTATCHVNYGQYSM